MGPSAQGSAWWQRPNQTTRGPTTTTSGGGWVPPPPAVTPPAVTPPVVAPPTPAPWTGNMRSPGGDPLVPNTGQVGTPVPMAGGNPGGLLGMLFDPSQHGNLAYAGMANAGNKGLDYTSASSRGMTDQILGQPIPVGGYGIGTGLGNAAPAFDVRAARLAAPSDADQAAQVAGTGPDDFWNTIMQATSR